MGRMRLIFIMIIAGISSVSPVIAQTGKLQQGVDQFMDGSYYKAMDYLSQAITMDRSMTPEMLTQAYYYRGLTYIRLYNEAYSGDDKEDQKLYRDALLDAYKDFRSAITNDDGKYLNQIDLEVKNLHHPLLQEGLISLNNYNDLVFKGKPDPKMLARAEDYLGAAHEIRESYLVCDLLGQVFLDKGQKEEAAGYFEKSEKLYTEKLPDEPDFLMAYVFYRLAAIHKQDDIRLAMQDNQRGLKFLESEYARYSAMKNKLSAARAKEMEDQYKLALQDLTNLKLDLYLSDSDQYVEALHVFEQEMASDPANVDIIVGYASLLEQSDKEKAILNYKKALGLDPKNSIALYNLGALYYAKGKEMFETAGKASDDEQYKLLTDEAMGNFKTARGYFELALAEEPQSLEIIQALKTIAFVLDDKPAYEKYKDLESKCTK
jgi:tetratricopeptide (TPR) repeat protein